MQRNSPPGLCSEHRGAAHRCPNAGGTLALYTLSTHDFRGDGKTAKEVRVMDLRNGESKQLSDSDKVSDATWVPGSDEDVIYLKSGEKGHVGNFGCERSRHD